MAVGLTSGHTPSLEEPMNTSVFAAPPVSPQGLSSRMPSSLPNSDVSRPAYHEKTSLWNSGIGLEPGGSNLYPGRRDRTDDEPGQDSERGEHRGYIRAHELSRLDSRRLRHVGQHE